MKNITQKWLAKATADFKYAVITLDIADDFAEEIAFHFQQAAEKFIKAVIIEVDLPFEKTHDLLKLKDILAPQLRLSVSDEDLAFLTDFSVEYRYPHFESVSKEDVLYAQEVCEKIKEAIEDFLSAR
jgi:HEPN domain-containing protein